MYLYQFNTRIFFRGSCREGASGSMVTKGGPGGVNRTLWSDLVRYINDETSPVNRNTLALVPPAADLEALAQPSLPDQEARQLVHDMWCHPGNDMEQIFKALRGRGFPRGFITKLRKFHCATCAVSKLTRSYRRSKRVKVAAAKRVKVAAAKRAPQAHTLREPSTSLLAICNAALLPHICLLARQARQKRMGEIRCSRAACALPRRGTRLAPVWVLRHRPPAPHASPEDRKDSSMSRHGRESIQSHAG